MTNLMEEVMRTRHRGGCARRDGFKAPAAGKTGTSHDGWFAGYTSDLLCIVWVGFDDNRELDLEGAHSAAPIWGEFMKRALSIASIATPSPSSARRYRLRADRPCSGMPATPMCPTTISRSLHRRHAAGRILPPARRAGSRV